MALVDPKVYGINCRLSSVDQLNTWLDDIDWWRANVRSTDSSIYQVIARTPLSAEDKNALRHDFDAMGSILRHVLLDSLKLVVSDADGIVVTWKPVPNGAQPCIVVAETSGVVAIEIQLCGEAPTPEPR